MADTHWATVVKDITTVVGIVVGGGWALWKWGIAEWLRRSREIPALDASLRGDSVFVAADSTLVVFKSVWRNRGPWPIELDPNRTVCQIYRLPNALNPGPLRAQVAELKPEYEDHPLQGLTDYTLEPSTESTLQSQFVVSTNSLYFVRLRLYQLATEDFWKRELVWSTSVLGAPGLFTAPPNPALQPTGPAVAASVGQDASGRAGG